jgi:hypothetical protein
MRISKLIAEDDTFNPKKVFEDLIERCKKVRKYEIQCIIDESWAGVAPFDMIIEDGIFTCFVIAESKRDAFLQVANKLPVIRFITKQDE